MPKEPSETNKIIEDSISRIIPQLKTSLGQKLSENLAKLKSEKIEYKSSETFQGIPLTICLQKANSYIKIENDFPDTLVPSTLGKYLDAIRLNLANICSFNLDYTLPSQAQATKVYECVKDFLYSDFFGKKLKNSNNQESFLNLINLLLDKEVSVRINEKYSDLFHFFRAICEGNRLNLRRFINTIDAIEKLDCFSEKTLFAIKKSFYAVLFLTDPSSSYSSLLTQIKALAESEFSDNKQLKTFIKSFSLQCENDFSKTNTLANNFEFAILLIYQCLYKKRAESKRPKTVNAVFINIQKKVKKTMQGELELGTQLIKFKEDYKQKTGNELKEDRLKQGAFSKGSQILRIQNLEIGNYFSINELNRAPLKVREVFQFTLEKCKSDFGLEVTNGELPADLEKTMYLDNLKTKFSTVKNVVAKKFNKFVNDVSQTITTVSSEFQELRDEKSQLIGLSTLENTISISHMDSTFPLPVSTEKKDMLKKLGESQNKLKRDDQKLEDFLLKLEELDNNGTKEHGKSVIFDGTRRIDFSDSENLSQLESQIENVEKHINSFYFDLVQGFIKKIWEIKNLCSWFEGNSINQVNSLERLFKRGYLYKEYIKLVELRNSINQEINFSSEKDFFLKSSFFSLLKYGIIRWPWINKEVFATQWAEQIIFLKVTDKINKASYTQDLECIMQLYKQVIYNKTAQDYSIVKDFHPDLIKVITHLKLEIGILLSKIDYFIRRNQEETLSLLPTAKTNTNRVNSIFSTVTPEQTYSSSSQSSHPIISYQLSRRACK